MAENTVTQNVVLGSGRLFIAELAADGTIPETLFNEANKLGHIQGGAELTYTPTIYDVECDEGKILKSYITKEEVILKSGVLTWNMELLSKLAVGGAYSNGVLTIGGTKSIKQYAIGFKYDGDDRTIKVSMAGRSNKGFTVAFNKEKETVIDAEFKAVKDANDVLVKIEETAKTAA